MSATIRVCDQVSAAISARKPVLAMESTIFTHGLPRPRNVETALMGEQIARDAGVVPATSAWSTGSASWACRKLKLSAWAMTTPW